MKRNLKRHATAARSSRPLMTAELAVGGGSHRIPMDQGTADVLSGGPTLLSGGPTYL